MATENRISVWKCVLAILTEVWCDAEAIEFHKNRDHFARLGELKAEYVENTEFMKFNAEQV